MNQEQIEQASDQIAADLFGAEPPEETTETTQVEGAETTGTTTETTEATAEQTQIAPRRAPDSWAKEQHERWGKLDKDTQDYIEKREKQYLDGLGQYKEFHGMGKAMHEVVTPYMPIIQAQGLEPAKAVAALLNAHYKLTQGPLEQRKAVYEQLGRNLGIVTGEAAKVDPVIGQLNEKVQTLEQRLTSADQKAFEENKAKVTTEVTSFADAKDDKGNLLHPHFDEVAEDITVFVQAGLKLQDAYDRAVWANPITREKENARLKSEAEAALIAKGKKEAEDARKASSTNVRSRDTRKAPTEPLGTIDDTLKDTLAKIKARTH